MEHASTVREYGVAAPGYRLPELTELGSARLQVSNLDRSVAYYRDVLGLRVLQSDAASATLGPRDAENVILELRERRRARAVPQGGLLGLYHFAILLPDRPSLGRLVRHLITQGLRFGSADHFVSEATYLWDPDGLGIEVYADRPREAWRANGRELVMGTEQLDLRALVEAGGKEPWAGMPSGTRMGHMHLSVGDLGQARAFYHGGLGLDLTVWSYPGALFLSAGGYHHQLGTNTWVAGVRAATDADARLLEWEILLPQASDVQTAVQSMRAAGYGASVLGEDGLLVDPWGTRLRLRGGTR